MQRGASTRDTPHPPPLRSLTSAGRDVFRETVNVCQRDIRLLPSEFEGRGAADPLPALLGRCTAINDEFTAGDKRRLLGGKIQHAIGDICGRAGSAEWDTPQPFVP